MLELESMQGEANTRILLHSAHAATPGFRAVVIVSDDIDVFLCLQKRNNSFTVLEKWDSARVKYCTLHAMCVVMKTKKGSLLHSMNCYALTVLIAS